VNDAWGASWKVPKREWKKAHALLSRLSTSLISETTDGHIGSETEIQIEDLGKILMKIQKYSGGTGLDKDCSSHFLVGLLLLD
jgi:hypothetical protein